MKSEFLRYLKTEVKNGSIYVWGGQGESNISESWIKKMETTPLNAQRAIAFWKKRKAQGYKNLKAFDCSGLVMYFLQNKKKYYSYDKNSDAIMRDCKKIDKNEVQPADFAFRIDSNGRAYHMGVVVEWERNVIEAKGRDDGVVKRNINADSDYWDVFYRHPAFEEEIKKNIWNLSGLLKYSSKGEDVLILKRRLKKLGYIKSYIPFNKRFGHNVENGVKKLQQAHGLNADGIVGEKTAFYLSAIYKK